MDPRPGNHAFYYHLTCKHGSFKSFKVSMNYALYTTPPNAQVLIGKNVHSLKCKGNSGSKKFTCSGVRVPAKKTVNGSANEHAFPCSASPPLKVTVTIARKKFHPAMTSCAP